MGQLQNILSQKIGIFYKDTEWKGKIFGEIVEYYSSLDIIEFHRYSKWDVRIVLKDNTEIIFVEANERCKGHKFSKAIIQPEVDQSIIDNVIRPCIVPFMGTQCYVFDIYNNEIKYR